MAYVQIFRPVFYFETIQIIQAPVSNYYFYNTNSFTSGGGVVAKGLRNSLLNPLLKTLLVPLLNPLLRLLFTGRLLRLLIRLLSLITLPFESKHTTSHTPLKHCCLVCAQFCWLACCCRLFRRPLLSLLKRSPMPTFEFEHSFVHCPLMHRLTGMQLLLSIFLLLFLLLFCRLLLLMRLPCASRHKVRHLPLLQFVVVETQFCCCPRLFRRFVLRLLKQKHEIVVQQ